MDIAGSLKSKAEGFVELQYQIFYSYIEYYMTVWNWMNCWISRIPLRYVGSWIRCHHLVNVNNEDSLLALTTHQSLHKKALVGTCSIIVIYHKIYQQHQHRVANNSGKLQTSNFHQTCLNDTEFETCYNSECESRRHEVFHSFHIQYSEERDSEMIHLPKCNQLDK